MRQKQKHKKYNRRIKIYNQIVTFYHQYHKSHKILTIIMM